MDCQLTYDSRAFQPDRHRYEYAIAISKFIVDTNFATSHTIGAYLDSSSAQFLSAEFLRLFGHYSFSNAEESSERIDRLKMDIDASVIHGTLYGFIVRYLFVLKNNYFGSFENFCTSDEYRTLRDDQQTKTEYDQHAIIKDRFTIQTTNPLEIWLNLRLYSNYLHLPDELYAKTDPLTIDIPYIMVAITNTHQYQDFVLDVPIFHLTHHANTMTTMKPTCLTFCHTILDTARIYGPRSKALTYVSRWRILTHRIFGTLDVSCLVKFMCWTKFFFSTFLMLKITLMDYQLINSILFRHRCYSM